MHVARVRLGSEDESKRKRYSCIAIQYSRKCA